MTRFWIASVLVVVGFSSGCGNGMHPVKGVVLMDGAPLEGVTVSFLPTGTGPSAFALTNAEGKFQLSSPSGEGTPAGTYVVTLSKVTDREPDQAPPWLGRVDKPPTPAERAAWQTERAKAKAKEKEWIPAQYRTSDKTPLKLTVPLSEELVIKLTSETTPGAPAK